jgi:fatty acid kinase fatty acid binding subunit
MGRTGIVCDSTADLEPAYLAERGVTMVPLTVFFGDEGFLDWVDMRPDGPDGFYERLKVARKLPTTSQPAPVRFGDAYRALAEAGCDSVVTITLSAKLSGTFESATIAAADSPVPVAVVDTAVVSHGAGLVVEAVADARDAGATFEELERIARGTSEESELFFVLETLDYLVKGGRAGRAQGLAASVLDIKPVLRFEEGIIAPFRKTRGTHRAFAELAAHVTEDAQQRGPLRAAVFHACDPDRAELLVQALEASGADLEIASIGLVGAVIGTYAGPGAVGLAYHPVR